MPFWPDIPESIEIGRLRALLRHDLDFAVEYLGGRNTYEIDTQARRIAAIFARRRAQSKQPPARHPAR